MKPVEVTEVGGLQPITNAVLDRHGCLDADIAHGTEVRRDLGSQYRSQHFAGAGLAWADRLHGLTQGLTRRTGVQRRGAERWIETLKQQCLWAPPYRDFDDLRQAVGAFTDLYTGSVPPVWRVGTAGRIG